MFFSFKPPSIVDFPISSHDFPIASEISQQPRLFWDGSEKLSAAARTVACLGEVEAQGCDDAQGGGPWW